MKFVIGVLLIGSFAFADEAPKKQPPVEKILARITKSLDGISDPETFKVFIDKNKKYFPDYKMTNPSIEVGKDKLVHNDVTYSSYVGYRQVLIKGNKKTLMSLWTTPELFQKIYALDDSSKVDGAFTKSHFKARIFKKVPAIEDQDYILEYKVTEHGPYTFIRAKLDSDKADFALRDNLKVLEETEDGLLVREISYLYPKKWYVNALGAVVQSMMKKEINKVSVVEKCLVEEGKTFPPADKIISECTK